MTRRRSVIGLTLAIALAVSAIAAQAASAAGSGQTIQECAMNASIKDFSDAHCDNAVTPTGTFGHVRFPETETAITLTNGATKNSTTEATTAVFKIALLHGFSNVVIECTKVEGIGLAQNFLSGTIHIGLLVSDIKFNNGTSGGLPIFCHTNQSGCEGGTTTVGAKFNEVEADGETVEGSTLKENGIAGGMGLKFLPPAGKKLTAITFEGTCGLHAFGAMNVEGSAIATAGGSREGRGATMWFVPGEMNSLSLGGQPVQLEGKLTLKRTSTGSALTLTTA